ncbi:MAG: polyprenyl diphosphate synthase [Candidatus Aenigmarchaeota archaeon]
MKNDRLHIGIIPDGSRRWARLQDIKNYNGWKSGETMERIVMHIFEKHPEVSDLSIWAMSTENLERNESDKRLVYGLLKEKINDFFKGPFIEDENIKVNVVGSKLREIPKDIKKLTDEAVFRTKGHRGGKTINICIGYGGRQEILDATMSASKWLRKNPTIAKIHKGMFEKYLLIPKPLDMVIRTGGEKRLSGFMLYQIEYAELFFTDTLWPDFTAREFDMIIKEFNERNRRFGR